MSIHTPCRNGKQYIDRSIKALTAALSLLKDREGRIVDMHYSDSDHHNTLVAQVRHP